MPSFVQVFIEKPVDVAAGRPFEDQLYRLRRKLEKHIIPMSCLSAACPVRQLFIKGCCMPIKLACFSKIFKAQK